MYGHDSWYLCAKLWPNLSKMREVHFLLIDDDSDDREFFKIALSKLPYSISYSTALDGFSALDILSNSQNNPNFIFLDLNMPLLSGKECLTQIRQMPAHKEVPVIIFSTSSYQVDIEDCQRLGATHFFTKVHKIELLTKTLQKLISGNKQPFVLNS